MYVLVPGRSQAGRRGVRGCIALHTPPRHPTRRRAPGGAPLTSPELHVGAKAQGNARLPGEALTARSHQAGQSSMGTGSPWKSKQTLVSGNPSRRSPGVPGSLFCRIQRGIWPTFPIFNPTSTSWKPSKHFFFCFSQV